MSVDSVARGLAVTALNSIGSGPMTNPMTTLGDTIYGGASGIPTRLGIGSVGQVLTVSGGAPAWGAPSVNNANWSGTALAIGNGGTGQTSALAAFNALSPMTTAGDLIIGGTSGSALRLGKDTDGKVLTLVSGAPAWAAATGGMTNPMTTAGDLIIGGSSGTPARLAKGTDTYVLTMTSGSVGWAAPSGGSSTLTINTTATSGATAGQILYSDGSNLQAGGAVIASSLALGGATHVNALDVAGNVGIAGSVFMPGNPNFQLGATNLGSGGVNGQFTVGQPGAPFSSFYLFTDANNVMALLNGTNANTFRVYNTGPTNYERGVFGFTDTTNVLTIGTQYGGTGTFLRPVSIVGANLSLFGASGSFGSGTGVIFIANDSADPSSNPTGGGILFVSAGALKYRGSSGTVTTLGNA